MQPGIVQQQTADSTRPYLTSDEAATHLGLSKRTLENFRTHGGGPRFHKFGRKMSATIAMTLRLGLKTLAVHPQAKTEMR